MKIFVAGATGAIGQPLVLELIRQGHEVTGLTSNAAGAKLIASLGARVAQLSVFDAVGVETALRQSQAEVVIDELTSLPKDHAHIAASAAADRKVRWEGGGNLQRAAMAIGVRRYIQQASGFFLKPSQGLADESAGLITDASPFVTGSARLYQDLEARLQKESPYVMDSSMVPRPGTAPRELLLIALADWNCRSWGRVRASGHGCISKTQPWRQLLL